MNETDDLDEGARRRPLSRYELISHPTDGRQLADVDQKEGELHHIRPRGPASGESTTNVSQREPGCCSQLPTPTTCPCESKATCPDIQTSEPVGVLTTWLYPGGFSSPSGSRNRGRTTGQ